MGSPVFANGMEISSKSMSGKSICEFPDVCLTPPQTPATPPGVPIPYPNTAMASDTSDGSKSVQIGGQEVMLKNKSFFKKTTGDEAGSTPKKGLMTTTTKGKAYFIAWSMDVKAEGENVVRHLDMTTHNHGCANATGLVPTIHAAKQALAKIPDCGGDAEKINTKCAEKDGEKDDGCPGLLSEGPKGQRTHFTPSEEEGKRGRQAGEAATKQAEADPCTKAMRCFLRPYKHEQEDGGCCRGQTPHHIPPHSMLEGTVSGHKHGDGLCVCLEGTSQHIGSHGENHAALDHLAATMKKPDGTAVVNGGKCSLKDYNTICAKAVAEQCNCSQACIENQLNAKHPGQGDTEVTHYQSNSARLSDDLKQKLNTEPPVNPVND